LRGVISIDRTLLDEREKYFQKKRETSVSALARTTILEKRRGERGKEKKRKS